MACAAEIAGITYGQMGSQFVRMAASRHPVFGKTTKLQGKETKKTVAQKPRSKQTFSSKAYRGS
jgi:hypothetical protein